MEISDKVKMFVLADRIKDIAESLNKHNHIEQSDKYGTYLLEQLIESSERLSGITTKLTMIEELSE
jgi:hypothetical protein